MIICLSRCRVSACVVFINPSTGARWNSWREREWHIGKRRWNLASKQRERRRRTKCLVSSRVEATRSGLEDSAPCNNNIFQTHVSRVPTARLLTHLKAIARLSLCLIMKQSSGNAQPLQPRGACKCEQVHLCCALIAIKTTSCTLIKCGFCDFAGGFYAFEWATSVAFALILCPERLISHAVIFLTSLYTHCTRSRLMWY